jgi:sugar phosphate isomerase/epimerase
MAIKIAAYPKCFEYDIGLHRTMSVFDWIALAEKELEVEGLEMYHRFFTRLDRRYLQQVADVATDAGFAIPMLIYSPDFTNPDVDERKRAIEGQVEMIEAARLLGGPGTVCRVLSGQNYPGLEREQGVEWVVEAFEQVIPVARENEIILGFENHYKDSQWEYAEFALKMDIFLEIVDAIDERQYFGVQFDPSNALIAGEDPIDLLEQVKDRVVSMHASDRYVEEGVDPEELTRRYGETGYGPSLRHGVVGEGLNDYDRIFAILSEVNYSGWISIEDGLDGIREIQTSAEFLAKLCKEYFGQ